jgi:hypothetical protein
MNTYEELKFRQGWTLEQKIDHSVGAVSTFLAKTDGKGYISYSGGKDSGVMLDIKLTEKPMELGEVVVCPKINKAAALNEMATLGARMFSVEEASRYAGGMDDPARLASGFAGVSTEAANNNGISIHGNSPSLLQWRIEGVEVSNVNHFADITQAGGGFLSALSSNVVGNSDFFTGAFPAEYGNAVAGMLPIALAQGAGAEWKNGLAWVLIGGLLSSMFLTLVIVPLQQ